MATLDVSALHWNLFSDPRKLEDAAALFKSLVDPKGGYLSGLAFFQKSNAAATTALETRKLKRDDVEIEIRQEWIQDACAIGDDLNLHAYQAYRLRELVEEIRHPLSEAAARAEAVELYYAERVSLLHTICSVLRDDFSQGREERNQKLEETVEKLHAKGVITKLLHELAEHLRALRSHPRQPPAPLTGGENELQVLVDIAMYSCRKRCCQLAALVDLCTAIKQLPPDTVAEQISIKLALIPMLGYGLWRLLELQRADQHPLYDEFRHLQQFFMEWNFEEATARNLVIRDSWNLFERRFKSLPIPAGDVGRFGTVNEEGGFRMPAMVQKILPAIEGIGEESMVREALLVLLTASLMASNILSEEHTSLEAFKAIADVCDGQRFLFHALMCTPTHQLLQGLCRELLSCMNISPRHAMTFLMVACSRELSTEISGMLGDVDHRVVVIHSDADWRYISFDAASNAYKAVIDLSPAFGFQVPIAHGSHGRVYRGHCRQWLMRGQMDWEAIEWTGYRFGHVFMFAYTRCVTLLSSMDAAARPAVMKEVLSMVQFAVAYMDVTPTATFNEVLPFKKLNKQPGRDTTLVKDTVFLVEVFLAENEDIYSIVKLLRHLCRQNPRDVIEALFTSSFFNGSGESGWSVEEFLVQAGNSPCPKTFKRAEAVISLLAEFVAQTYIFDSLGGWIHTINRTLLTKLKQGMDPVIHHSKADLLGAILELMHQTLLLGSGNSLASGFYRDLKEGFVIEDCVQGILKSLPMQLNETSVHQTQLVTAVCHFLADLLSEEIQLERTLIVKILKFLLTPDYWDHQSPASKLALFVAKGSFSNDPHIADAECALAALTYFNAVLRQFECHRAALGGLDLKSALPFLGSELHPAFLEGVSLYMILRGHRCSEDRVRATFNLFVTACDQNSEFLPCLMFPTALAAESTTQTGSLLDVMWGMVSDQEIVFRDQPYVLSCALRGMRALQKSTQATRDEAWRILRGQNEFLEALLEIALKQPSRLEDPGDLPELERFRYVHEHCQGLAMEILCHELSHGDGLRSLTALLATVLERRWDDWTQLLENVTSGPHDEFISSFLVISNCMVFETLAALAPEGSAHGAVIPWTHPLRQEVNEILDRAGVTLVNVVNHIQSILEPAHETDYDMSARLLLLKSPSGHFSFLAAELHPVKALLEQLLKPDPIWKKQPFDLTTDSDMESSIESLPECVTSNCLSYGFFNSFLRIYHGHVRVMSLRAQIVASWRLLTQAIFANAPTDSVSARQSLERLNTLVANRCLDWIRCSEGILNVICSQVKSQDTIAKMPLMQQELFCNVQFTAELAAAFVDLTNVASRFKSAEGGSQSHLRDSPAPFHRRQAEHGIPTLPTERLMESLEYWFRSISHWSTCPEAPHYRVAIQKTTQNLILLSSPVLPKLSSSHGSNRAVLDTVLSGILSVTDPSIMGFLTANAALAAVAKWTEYIPEWEEDRQILLHQKLHLQRLFHVATQYIRRLVVDSRNPEEDREIQLWSTNLLKLCSCLMHHPELHVFLIKPQVLEQIWLYTLALFSPQGADLGCRDEEPVHYRAPGFQQMASGASQAVEFAKDVHIRKAYRMDGSPNPAFQQWCLMLRVVGDVVYLQKQDSDVQVMQLYERCATALFHSLKNYIHADFGTYYQPLTLERVYRMEATLRFLLMTHRAFSGSVTLLSNQVQVGQCIMAFLHECHSILSHPDREVVCPPVSMNEKEMDQREMTFDTELGWFQICKNGAHRVWFPKADQTPFGERTVPSNQRSVSAPQSTFRLTHYSWRVAKGLYSCMNLSLEYLRASVQNRLRRDAVVDQTAFREMMTAFQADVTGLGNWLTNAMASEESRQMRHEIKDLAQSLVNIAHVTEEMLSEWGLQRRRRQQEVLNSHIDTLRQLVDHLNHI